MPATNRATWFSDAARTLQLAAVAIAVAVTCPAAFGQDGTRPWEEYSRHIARKSTVEGLSTSLFNEQVDLSNGRLSFSHVDIDLPGNTPLPVTLARTFNVDDPVVVDTYGNANLLERNDFPFVDWELDVPRIEGVFATKLRGPYLHSQGLDPNPNGINHAWSPQRCTGKRVPPFIGEFAPMDYWHGLVAKMPGGGEVMSPAPGAPMPTAGTGYRWVTSKFTWFSCLPTIRNGTGEGFLAIDANGTKYWFDWMAMYKETTLDKSFLFVQQGGNGDITETVYEQYLDRKLHVLYATRVEDRFGNWVEYQYSNAATAPARLNRIHSSDGRQININYSATGAISSANDGTRTWTYGYGANQLSTVTLPDASRWNFDLKHAITSAYTAVGHWGTCNYPGYLDPANTEVFGTKRLSMTHPSGASAEFHVGLRLHGRGNVPRACIAVITDNAPELGGYSDYVRMYWTNSLLKKRILGPGLAPMEWNYTYNDSHLPSQPRSAFTPSYVPPGSWAPPPYTYTRVPDDGMPDSHITTYSITNPTCMSPTCATTTSTDVAGPDGTWSRHTFGNSFRYNEGLLLKVERGSGPGNVLEVEQSTFDMAQVGRPLPIAIGVTRQYRGTTINDAGLRPLRSRVTTRDGVRFSQLIESYDGYGRPVRITKSSAAVQ